MPSTLWVRQDYIVGIFPRVTPERATLAYSHAPSFVKGEHKAKILTRIAQIFTNVRLRI
jgi:hypothetical protein